MTTLISKTEAVRRLGISTRTFDRIHKKDGIPTIRVGGAVKIPEKELEEWITARIQRGK